MLYGKLSSFIDKFYRFNIGLALFFGVLFVRAFAVMQLWNWFVVVAANVNRIPLAIAFGLMLLVMLFTWGLTSRSNDSSSSFLESTLRNLLREVIACCGALVIGYFIHAWYIN